MHSGLRALQGNNMKYLRTKEVAQQMSIGVSTLFDWTNPKSSRFKADFPKPIKVGRSTFYVQSEISDYMQQRQPQAET